MPISTRLEAKPTKSRPPLGIKNLFRYNHLGNAEFDTTKNMRLWYYLPKPAQRETGIPDVKKYFTQPLCIWQPRKMWQLKLYCPHQECNKHELLSCGMYTRVRQVLDISGYYSVASEYLECGQCGKKFISWSDEILNQFDVGHRRQFPCIITTMRVI